jgi:hypothetical protein
MCGDKGGGQRLLDGGPLFTAAGPQPHGKPGMIVEQAQGVQPTGAQRQMPMKSSCHKALV